ncbi:hypothetical protein MTBPR1_60033 [Candidatus Terasakiella magnetica]|uniref:Uncharacterized protein n=1 Tax=Candidatus Terasakiella magnetica TaxID=1867952 RepID=A0A1C3RJQ5_9PROT|nr:hypothetical protein [Candidatus Terasakiella magnetica]SCA57520.1 hypothetical protein MTBPR1_60033 [Candidatus Terasakiella magnetica]
MAAQFIIQVKNGNRWSMYANKDNESQAVKQARQLLKQQQADEAQVIKKGDGPDVIIFDENQNSVRKKAGLGHIKSSPVFKTTDDLFTPANVEMLNKMLRDYCEQMVVSMTELLHTQRALEKFQDDPLASSAFHHLAELQAAAGKLNETEQQGLIFDFFSQAQDKARRAGFDEIPEKGLNDYLAQAGDLSDPEVRYRVNLSLARILTRAPSWESKMTELFALLDDEVPVEELHDNTKTFLDGLLSEWFMYQLVIQDMLGTQPDRYNAIDVLTKLCIAKYEARKWDTPGLKGVSALMLKLPMAKTRSRLANRIEQMLRARTALTKGDVFEEKHAFKQLLPLFISKSGTILGGEGMAEALTMCGTRSFSRDKNLDKPGEAIDYIMENLDAPILQLRFLMTLSKSQFGKDCSHIVCDFLPKFMDGPEHVHDIVHYKLPLKRKLKTITDLQKSAMKIELPQNTHVTFVEWLDNLLYNYLDEERIIDKMDSPEETLFNRATALLQFCASGILIEGKTLNWVRARVQEHLRQPNFVEKFTEEVETPKKKELVITQLHAMLKKAGLQQ